VTWEQDFNAWDELDLNDAYVLLTNDGFGEDVTMRNSFDPTNTIAIAKIKADRLPVGNFLFQVAMHSMEQFVGRAESGIGHAILCIVREHTVTVWNPSGGGTGMSLVADALVAALNKFPGNTLFTTGDMSSSMYTFAIQQKLHYGNNLCQSLVVLKMKDLLTEKWPGKLETYTITGTFDDTEAFRQNYLSFSAPPPGVTKSHGEWAGLNAASWLPDAYKMLETIPHKKFKLFYIHRPRQAGHIFREGFVGVAGSLTSHFYSPAISEATKIAVENLSTDPQMAIDLLKMHRGTISDDSNAREDACTMIPELMRFPDGRSAVHTYCDDLMSPYMDTTDFLSDFDEAVTNDVFILGKTDSIAVRICLLVAQTLHPGNDPKSAKWERCIPQPTKSFHYEKLAPYFEQLKLNSFYEIAEYLFDPNFQPPAPTNPATVYLPDATELPVDTLMNNDNIKLLIAPRVTKIPDLAFQNCPNLKVAFLPGVEKILESAVVNCPKFKYPKSLFSRGPFIDLAA